MLKPSTKTLEEVHSVLRKTLVDDGDPTLLATEPCGDHRTNRDDGRNLLCRSVRAVYRVVNSSTPRCTEKAFRTCNAVCAAVSIRCRRGIANSLRIPSARPGAVASLQM